MSTPSWRLSLMAGVWLGLYLCMGALWISVQAGAHRLDAPQPDALRENAMPLQYRQPITSHQHSMRDGQYAYPSQALATLTPLPASPQATVASRWPGLELARALAQTQEQQALALPLWPRFSPSDEAQALVRQKI